MNILREDQNSKLLRNSHSYLFEPCAIYKSQQRLPPFNKVQTLDISKNSSRMFCEAFSSFYSTDFNGSFAITRNTVLTNGATSKRPIVLAAILITWTRFVLTSKFSRRWIWRIVIAKFSSTFDGKHSGVQQVHGGRLRHWPCFLVFLAFQPRPHGSKNRTCFVIGWWTIQVNHVTIFVPREKWKKSFTSFAIFEISNFSSEKEIVWPKV